MLVFRITHEKWSGKLSASGNPARWNSRGKYVIYAAASRALACLENLVHRSGEGLNQNFKVSLIEIPDDLKMIKVQENKLPENWKAIEHYRECQMVGDDWIEKGNSAVLVVPSAVIPKELVYVINFTHPDFSKIKLKATESFDFDSRLSEISLSKGGN